MFTEGMLSYNLILFLGLGAEVLTRPCGREARQFFMVVAANSLSIIATTAAAVALQGTPAALPGFHGLFLFSLAFSFMSNRIVLRLLGQDDGRAGDSVNTAAALFPIWAAGQGLSAGGVLQLAAGGAAGYFTVASLFYFIRLRIARETQNEGEFPILCRELVTLGIMSISFSLFFKVV